MNPIELYNTVTLRNSLGPLPATAVQGLAGTGIGYLIGKLLNRKNTPKRRAQKRINRSMLLGGLAGAAPGLIESYSQYQLGNQGKIPGIKPGQGYKALFNPHPYNQTALNKESASTFGADPVFKNRSHISVNSSIDTIMADPTLSPLQKAIGVDILDKADQAGRKGGLITTGDIVSGAVGAGLGYGAGLATGKVMGTVFGLPKATQKRLAQAGALGGLLRMTGIWQ